MSGPEIRAHVIQGLDGVFVQENVPLGHLIVEHDGSITWDQLQIVKNEIWGEAARAIEVYPVQADIVNTGNYRHLWRLGRGDFCPDLLGEGGVQVPPWDMTLEERCRSAWRAAEEVFK